MSYRWRLFLGEPVGTYGSAVAVFESPFAQNRREVAHEAEVSATDSAVETAVTRPQATTTYARNTGKGGEGGGGGKLGRGSR